MHTAAINTVTQRLLESLSESMRAFVDRVVRERDSELSVAVDALLERGWAIEEMLLRHRHRGEVAVHRIDGRPEVFVGDGPVGIVELARTELLVPTSTGLVCVFDVRILQARASVLVSPRWLVQRDALPDPSTVLSGAAAMSALPKVDVHPIEVNCDDPDRLLEGFAALARQLGQQRNA